MLGQKAQATRNQHLPETEEAVAEPRACASP